MAAVRLELSDPVELWVESLKSGDRSTLARLFTLAESRRKEHQEFIDAVLGGAEPAPNKRFGISGAPGVGKSSLIDALGMSMVASGQSVAVTSVDPSSVLSGGSVLGDKTRMSRLSNSDRAFIRPTPSGGTLGGVGRYTARCLELLNRAQFDVVILETVGVGQSELDAVSLVDYFVLVVTPSGGDELQGIKRGITEHVDLVVVNKSDLDPAFTQATVQQYEGALKLLKGRHVPVMTTSAKTGAGVDALWEQLSQWSRQAPPSRSERQISSLVEERIVQEASHVFQERVRALLRRSAYSSLIDEVRRGQLSAEQAGQTLFLSIMAPGSGLGER